ncbi:MAG: hypothetical protein O3B73_05850 [bacterium]|nr:hypothetical protein [bacterium]
MNLELAREGIQRDWLEASKAHLRQMVLPAAETYFAEGGTPFTQNHPQLKKSEMVQRFFDYQPCCMSVLGSIAKEGDERALVLIRRIFANTRYCLDEWREREGFRITFRRAQLHMVLCYAQLREIVEPAEAEEWRGLLLRTGADVFAHFNAFWERNLNLDNRGFGTGINHVSLSAEGMWKSGEVLGRPDWQIAAAGFVDRLLSYAHRDGYFEENTNDSREGGPSILYTPLTAGSVYLTQHWRKQVDVPLFSKIGQFSRLFVDAHLNPMPFADERANPHHQGPYGLALHSLTPEGRGFLRLTLEKIRMIDHVGGDIYMQHLARTYLELDHMETGPGEVPEPFCEGHHRLTLPLGVIRTNGWTAGLSSLKALNREIAAQSDYALDRQSLLHLSHATAGRILEGSKAKHNPDWSTVRLDDDAYPTQTGDLDVHSEGARARVIYSGFAVEITWTLGETAELKMASDFKGTLTTQLPLEMAIGDTFVLNKEQTVTLGDQAARFEHVQSLTSDRWQVETDQPGCLVWYIEPFSPYSEGNKTARDSWRPTLILNWEGRLRVSFRPLT